jgi:hypothetical protein
VGGAATGGLLLAFLLLLPILLVARVGGQVLPLQHALAAILGIGEG